MQREDETAFAGYSPNTGYGTENSDIDYAFRIAETAQPPRSRSGRRLVVCAASEIAPGEKRIVEDDSISVGVFNVRGEFYAIKNVCPHQGAPLCQGKIQTTHRPSAVHEFDPALEGRVIRCPWHGWEFDVVTGKGLYDRKSRVATYPVEIDGEGNIVVLL